MTLTRSYNINNIPPGIFWGTIVAASLICIYFYLPKTYTNEEINEMFEPLTNRYGVKFVYKIDDNFFSHLEYAIWPPGPPRTSKVTPIDAKDLIKYPGLLKKALAKYPDKLVKHYVKAIHFAKEIVGPDGFRYGGSYDIFGQVMYLAHDGCQDNNFSMYAFHHEFSSFMLRRHYKGKYSFDIDAWEDANPKGFQYLFEKYKDMMIVEKHHDTSAKGTEEDYKNGFLNMYAQTTAENDFNEYAAMVFTYPETFKELMNKYPKIREKFLIWQGYYHHIDPIFTEEYLLGGNHE